MQEEAFEAKNELETKLLAAMAGELSSEDFMRELMTQQVFIPVQDEPDSGIKGFQRSTKATPLVVEDDDGTKILIMFTSPERARNFLAEFPGFSGGLLVEFSWILERVAAGFAISVNPGLDTGIDIEPQIVTEMLQLLASQAARN